MKTIKISIAVMAITMLTTGLAHAQSNKYQRPGKKAAEPIAPAAGTAAPAPAKDAKAVDTKSEKVDIQQIESEYWQSKDTEFHVVQSRRFTKEKKPYLNVGYGLLVNDNFNRGSSYNLAVGYFYKEQAGFELFYDMVDADNSKATKEILALGGGPTYARPTAQYGVTWNWMPIYGKVSLLDQTIVYFDMGLHMGIGMAEYSPMIETAPASKQAKEASGESAPMLILDISQQFFISEKWALRFDIKNRFYKRDLKEFGTGAYKKTDTEHSTSAVFGLTYYFK